MKAAIVLLVAAFGLAVASEFSEYVAKHNKAYATNPTEFARREAIYTRNAEEIRRKRADMEAAGEEPWMGINEFTDMTVEEFAQSGRLMPRKLNADDARSCLAHGVTADYSGLDMSALPTDYDWREKGVVNPIQNQGQCGSCWTFSTIASIESAYAIKTGKLQKLAEQEVVDCSKGCVLEEGQQVCNDGCNGGWMWSAMNDIVGWKGEELESNYPYTAETGTCKRKPALTINPISNYTCLSGPNKANETEMAAFLVANGPISMAMDAGILQTYTSGIIKPSAGDCSKTQLDHALVIVGFGTQGSTEFWIVRNSWGESWGEKGYFRIIRGKGACGLNAGVVFPNI